MYEAGRAVLMYDCLVGEPADVIRVVEYLDVEGGLIRRIRQVYDVAALHRLVPPNA
ncbi:hypothetical protein Pme01_05730 [Planosporangium mesophilum]|uniref:SnoaL-like domain-containing protein n=1 Tax=Planosporangium mesophilum TaxID=689768 RepID=A0A8J3WYW8_9ACTN|nr:hypothetical protein Pme01_05730 [Planosporangium mesophilum]